MLDNLPENLAELDFGTGAEAAPGAGIPFMITRQMKEDLKTRGFTADQIKNTTPAEAQSALGSLAPGMETKDAPMTTLEQEDPRPADEQTSIDKPRPQTRLRDFDRLLNTESAQRWIKQFRPLTFADLKQLPKPGWLIDRHLPEDGLAGLFGEYSGGKSFIALDWALSVATGEPWLGHEVKQGGVFYIYAEGAGRAAARLEAWLKEHGMEDLPSQFQLIPCSVDVLDEEMLAFLSAAIAATGLTPTLIVIDTLARCFGSGDENSTKDMNAFVNGCDELRREFEGATVLVVHHTGKDANKGARGAVALPAAMDIAFTAKKPSRQSLNINLQNTKPHKDSGPLDDRHLTLEEVDLGEGQTSCVIRLANEGEIRGAIEKEGESPRAAKISGIEETFRALLGLMPKGGRHKDWMDASNKPKATFDRHRLQLIQDGRVKQNGDGSYVAAADPAPTVH
jgi:hypothetical protein